MVGMAVGVDYSLFYLQREREERRCGKAPHEALLRTASTSGQAVLISGATVLIAMAGMLFAGNAIFTTIGDRDDDRRPLRDVGSLSVLPALLHKLGDQGRQGPRPVRRKRRGEGPLLGPSSSSCCGGRSSRSSLAGGLLVALSVPAFSLHTKLPSFTDLPKDLPIVKTYKGRAGGVPGVADARRA